MQWQSIETAPKDGQTIWLSWFDGDEGPFDVCKMEWNKSMTNGLFPGVEGMWVSGSTGFTWNDQDGAGPTHFSWCTQ